MLSHRLVLVSHRILLQMRSTGTCRLHSSSSKLFWDQFSLKAVLVITEQKNNSPTVGPGYSLKIIFCYVTDWNRDLLQAHIWKYWLFCYWTSFLQKSFRGRSVSEGGLGLAAAHTSVFRGLSKNTWPQSIRMSRKWEKQGCILWLFKQTKTASQPPCSNIAL